MQNNYVLTRFTHTISSILHRYHILLFVLSAVGCLMTATMYLNGVITQSSASTQTSPYVGFDKVTINKVKALKTSQEQQAQGDTLALGRRNPFVE